MFYRAIFIILIFALASTESTFSLRWASLMKFTQGNKTNATDLSRLAHQVLTACVRIQNLTERVAFVDGSALSMEYHPDAADYSQIIDFTSLSDIQTLNSCKHMSFYKDFVLSHLETSRNILSSLTDTPGGASCSGPSSLAIPGAVYRIEMCLTTDPNEYQEQRCEFNKQMAGYTNWVRSAVSHCRADSTSSPLCSTSILGLESNQDNYYFVSFLNEWGPNAWNYYKQGNTRLWPQWEGQVDVGANPQDAAIKALYVENSAFALDFVPLK